MSWWQILLFPFAIIYDLVTRSRNWLYDIGLKKISSYPNLVILSVGNLSVGGTGKTPMVEYLIRYGLGQNWRIATLSRGYGRKTKGIRIANSSDSAESLGDESFGYFEQFGEEISVVVAEKRVKGIDEIRRHLPKINVVLLDDAFQHRSVLPDISFLLTTHINPFWTDHLIPSGRLREARKGHKRADMVIVTKSPQLLDVPFKVPTAFSFVNHHQVVMMSGEKRERVVAVAGLANTDDFFNYVSNNFDLQSEIRFSDHHSYSKVEIRRIINECKLNHAILITTYKDAVKFKVAEEMNKISWGYIPIEIEFVSGEDKLMRILQSLEKKVLPEG